MRIARLAAADTETNFAAAWLTGPLESCDAAAVAYREAVVRIAANPKGEVWGS